MLLLPVLELARFCLRWFMFSVSWLVLLFPATFSPSFFSSSVLLFLFQPGTPRGRASVATRASGGRGGDDDVGRLPIGGERWAQGGAQRPGI